MLEIQNLTVRYDTATLLNTVSLEVRSGEFVSIVGPNGAGKTTMLRAISGLVRWDQYVYKGTRYGRIIIDGTILFDGKRIDTLMPDEIVRRGLIHCPERRRPFAEMTVSDNLKAGGYLITDKRTFRQRLEAVHTLFPVLRERSKQLAGTLSGGEQQMLAIGRALMQNPRLLCIDEPSIGLAPLVKQNVFSKIREIHDAHGVTVLLVEQDVHASFSLSHRSYILSQGKIVNHGTPEELRKDETIRKSYLGL